MTRKRTLLPMLLVVLLLGLAAGFAGTNAGHADGGTTGDSPAVSTDSTTSDPAPTTTDPAPTTTVGDTTSGANTGASDQGATQLSQGDPTTTGQAPTPAPAATTTPPPTAPCDTTQLTCGNNAATQIAVVSQNCVAASSDPIISVSVTNIAGDPVNKFTIANVTSCLNIVNITQVVQQFCLGCTVIVIPPPPPPPPIIAAIDPPHSATPASTPTRMGYCMPQPVLRGDGTWGRFVNLVQGQPQHDAEYEDAVPATFTPGVGYACADGSVVAGANVPTFTLTVPASFVGQFVNLCIQPAVATKKPVCHAIKIDNGATVTIPVASNVAATVTAPVVSAADKPKSTTQIAAAATAYGQTLSTTGHSEHKPRKGKHS